MTIRHTTGGTIFTGDGVTYFRMAALRTVVGLEVKGIRMRPAWAWKQAKKEFGLTGGAEDVYNWLTAKVAELAAQQEHINESD